MTERTKTEVGDREERDTSTEVLRAGARKLVPQALEAQVTELVSTYAAHRDEQGRPEWGPPGSRDSNGDCANNGPSFQCAQSPEPPGPSVLLSCTLRAQDTESGRGVPWLYVKETSTGSWYQ